LNKKNICIICVEGDVVFGIVMWGFVGNLKVQRIDSSAESSSKEASLNSQRL